MQQSAKNILFSALISVILWGIILINLLIRDLKKDVQHLHEVQKRQLEYNQKNIRVMKKIIDLNTTNKHGRNNNRN